MGEQRQRTPVGSRRPRAVIAAILAAMTLPMISACGERTKAPPMRRPPDGMVLVPAGDYLVGSDETREGPSRTVHLEAFFIDKTPVRDEQYRAWVRRDKTAFDRWTGRLAESERMGRPGYPATNVSQAEASAYCKAQGKRLPLSYEYEAAARGTDGRVFPWGDTWRPDVVNDKAFGPVPVGNFPAGAGPTGAEDLVGNVFHWTRSRVRRTAFQAPERTDPVLGVIKAGGWPCSRRFNRATFRAAMNASFHSPWVGFRCAKPVDPDRDPNLDLELLPEPFTDRVFDTTEGLRQLFSYELLPGRRLHPEMAAHVSSLPDGAVVADVGAGIGFLSFALSRQVGVGGKVYAVDIDSSVLEFIDACHDYARYDNIETIHSSPTDTMLPDASCDAVYLLGTVHCLGPDTWRPFIRSCYKALKPSGVLVVQDNTSHPIVGTAAAGMRDEGFVLESYAGTLLQSESGRADAPVPPKVTDLSRQPAQGYLFRVYRKR